MAHGRNRDTKYFYSIIYVLASKFLTRTYLVVTGKLKKSSFN